MIKKKKKIKSIITKNMYIYNYNKIVNNLLIFFKI